MLTERFERALTYAVRAHASQLRKGSGVPFISHLLAVASLVLEDGGDEDEAVAALLHDVVEDQGGAERLVNVEHEFGQRVAAIVAGCSDTDEIPKPPWRARKQAYLEHLETASQEVLRVSLADKAHNVRSLLFDYRAEGEELWRRFDPESDQLWYYRSLSNVYSRRSKSPLAPELERLVAQLEEVALIGALQTLVAYARRGDYTGKFLILRYDEGRNYYVQFAVDVGGLFCEVVHNKYLEPEHQFSGDDIAALLQLGFAGPEDEEQNLFQAFELPEQIGDYYVILEVVEQVATEFFGLPPPQPIRVSRSWA